MVLEKRSYIENLVDGQKFCLALLVNSCRQQISKRGGSYLSLELSDRTGTISAKVWDEVERFQSLLVEGSVVEVSGQVSSYQGRLQLTIRRAIPLDWSRVDPMDFVLAARRDQRGMTKDLLAIMDSLRDPDYRRLVKAVLEHPKTRDFWTIPAAKSFHHSYQRGLLEHSLSVAQLAVQVSAHYAPFLDADLLVAGAILHDVGKCWEFTTGLATDYTTAGRFLGHLHMGAMFLGEVARELGDFPEDKLLLAQHLLVSHHGEPNFGSPQTPKLLEAVALHQIDDLDGKLNGIGAFIRQQLERRQPEQGRWTNYHHLLKEHYYATDGSPLWGEELENIQENPVIDPFINPVGPPVANPYPRAHPEWGVGAATSFGGGSWFDSSPRSAPWVNNLEEPPISSPQSFSPPVLGPVAKEAMEEAELPKPRTSNEEAACLESEASLDLDFCPELDSCRELDLSSAPDSSANVDNGQASLASNSPLTREDVSLIPENDRGVGELVKTAPTSETSLAPPEPSVSEPTPEPGSKPGAKAKQPRSAEGKNPWPSQGRLF
ncbi:MAG: HD domain-containing protein [Deltaproteobacteria bacterium]|nr:HD domain-containing protein [Deltaproteobacteria bacterium]